MDSSDFTLLVLLAAIPVIYQTWKIIEQKSNNDEIHEAIFSHSQKRKYHSEFFKSMKFNKDPAYRASEILKHLIAEARSSIDVAMYQFTADSLCPVLIEAKNRGVNIRVVIDHQSMYELPTNRACVTTLKNAGIEVKLFPYDVMMHIKMCLIDVPKGGVTLNLRKSSRIPSTGVTITGSANWTPTAFTKNEEMYVVTSNNNICQVSKDEFEVMWSEAQEIKNL